MSQLVLRLAARAMMRCVFLTISTTHQPATDLGYLLHKHPDRVQEFKQSFGTATVFYPEASDERCSVALLLSIDPVKLARSRAKSTTDVSLTQYVNDRSYAASSLLGVAVADVFSTARSGVCKSRQELADGTLPLEVSIPVLPCRGGPELARRIFEPLGWHVNAEPIELDEEFPEWGPSRYLALTLSGQVRLADVLSQLHVLLPVFDDSKHYWQTSAEVDKLFRSGQGWLADHPEAEFITRRYLARSRELVRSGLERLAELGDDRVEDLTGDGTPPARVVSLAEARLEAVHAAVTDVGAHSVIDLGCGSGRLLQRLVKDPRLRRIVGSDVDVRSLESAAKRLHTDEMGERQAERLELIHGALTYEDERFAGFDAAVLMEVIEHVDPSRHDALERVVFGSAAPRNVVVTTPNREYNVLYPDLVGMRHRDHRFEWDRTEFAAWSQHVCDQYGYRVQMRGIGPNDPVHGQPTQMAIFSREEDPDE